MYQIPRFFVSGFTSSLHTGDVKRPNSLFFRVNLKWNFTVTQSLRGHMSYRNLQTSVLCWLNRPLYRRSNTGWVGATEKRKLTKAQTLEDAVHFSWHVFNPCTFSLNSVRSEVKSCLNTPTTFLLSNLLFGFQGILFSHKSVKDRSQEKISRSRKTYPLCLVLPVFQTRCLVTKLFVLVVVRSLSNS